MLYNDFKTTSFSNVYSEQILAIGNTIFHVEDMKAMLLAVKNASLSSKVIINNSTNEIAGFTLVCKEQYVSTKNSDTSGEYVKLLSKIPNGYELAFLGVSTKFQGKGIGTRLLNETLEAIFQTSNNSSCWLVVEATNTNAIHLYTKNGFVWLKTITDAHVISYVMYKLYDIKQIVHHNVHNLHTLKLIM